MSPRHLAVVVPHFTTLLDRQRESLQNVCITQSDGSYPHYFHPVNPYPLSAVFENPWKLGVGCYQQDNPFSLLLSPLVQGHWGGSCRQAEWSPPLPSIFLTTLSFCIAKTSAHDLTATKVKTWKWNTTLKEKFLWQISFPSPLLTLHFQERTRCKRGERFRGTGAHCSTHLTKVYK